MIKSTKVPYQISLRYCNWFTLKRLILSVFEYQFAVYKCLFNSVQFELFKSRLISTVKLHLILSLQTSLIG